MTRHLRPWSLATTAILLLLAACQGDTTTPSESPGGTHLAGETPTTAPGDTAHSSPGTPAPTPPEPPPGASTIQLSVYVGVATGGPDTLQSTPVAKARVSVLSRTYTRSAGPDTLTVTETLVASGSTDALGKVSFSDLPAAQYRLEAAVDGRAPASIQIAPPYPGTFATRIIFRPAP